LALALVVELAAEFVVADVAVVVVAVVVAVDWIEWETRQCELDAVAPALSISFSPD
jgi:hypothetical protein